MNDKNTDIIAAIATAPGQGAIGIIRLSGEHVLNVLKQVFTPLPAHFASHKMYYGEIVNAGEVIDEVMVCPMLAPRSYTREDTVEIYAHGGMLVLEEVLKVVVAHGARLATPGEFTKRAFMNGRINLSQAEAVMDIISAGSQGARRAGLRQLGGGLTQRIEKVRDKILVWLAHIELSIDYPEHENEAQNASEILAQVGEVHADLAGLLETANIGRIMREGIKTAIIGQPNVGKSTLLNAILSEDRAIVHELPGTTRDVLTEQVRVGDLHLVIMDTAGIRETNDPIEKIGVEKSIQTADDADLIIYVADCTRGITPQDEAILKGLNNPLVIMNKADLQNNNTHDGLKISAKTGQGMDKLFAKIQEQFHKGVISSQESDIITRERHRVLIKQAIAYVNKAFEELHAHVPEDLVSISLRAAYIALGEVLGVEIGDDIVDRIFAEFCVGK
ncbi:MAG: tRNA uridine-5-carboxymethylaminomethyl(34) synthesis GTPase MnmE [Defluviitaleaceae bacterium]|nr:tRNA uridine-5-carboxymethylaminomethyl(34) synthesis GTPase MnmE [Defluviitaleaceae bacterium]